MYLCIYESTIQSLSLIVNLSELTVLKYIVQITTSISISRRRDTLTLFLTIFSFLKYID